MPKASSSGKIIVILICVFAVSIAVLNWRDRYLESHMAPAINNAQRIVIACKSYGVDHDGNYPPTLDALIPDYLSSKAALASPIHPQDPNGYIYHPGLTANSPPDAVILEDKFAPEVFHAPIVIHMDDNLDEGEAVH